MKAVENNQLYYLMLTQVPGLGLKGIAKILARNCELAHSIVDFFGLDELSLTDQYSLRRQVSTTLTHERSKLEASATRLQERLAQHHIQLLLPHDLLYPAALKTHLQYPTMLFALGNLALLETIKIALLNSRTLKPQSRGLELTCAFAQRVTERGHTLITSLDKSTYTLLAYLTERFKGNAIFMLDCGILKAAERLEKAHTLFPGLETIPFSSERHLLLSPFKPHEPHQKGNGPARDRLIITLSDLPVAVEVRKGGTMETELRKARDRGQRVAVCRYARDNDDDGNRVLIQAGCEPLTPDPRGLHLDAMINSVITAQRQTSEITSLGEVGSDDLARRQPLGQFFTPLEIADFMWEMLTIYHGGRLPKSAKAIDPAVGQGVFLLSALRHHLLPARNLFGVDIDEAVGVDWVTAFQEHPEVRLLIADGLVDNPWIGLEPESFDVVIGNPPYGGEGLRSLQVLLNANKALQTSRDQTQPGLFSSIDDAEPASEAAQPKGEALADLLFLARYVATHYESWKRGRVQYEVEEDEDIDESEEVQGKLFELIVDDRQRITSKQLIASAEDQFVAQAFENFAIPLTPVQREAVGRLATFPIEILFMERFVQLCKPGGYIAVILPDGLFANAQTQYFRDWLIEHGEVKAIVSLPRQIFTGVGANAKTHILFFRKYTPDERAKVEASEHLGEGLKPLSKDRVLMASMRYAPKPVSLTEYLHQVLVSVRTPSRNPGGPMKIKKSEDSVTMMTLVDPDKLKGQRWDPHFWDSQYEPIYKVLNKCQARPLGEFITYITYGQVGRRELSSRGTVKYLQVINIRDTGIDSHIKPDHLKEGSYNDLPRSRVQVNDILFTNNSFGGMTRLLGRCVVVPRDYGKINISQDIDIIRVSGINPYYVCVFIKSELGQKQVDRLKYGVRSTKLSFQQVRQILVPPIDAEQQAEIERQYRLMSHYHDQAMERKGKLITRRMRSQKSRKQITEIVQSDAEYARLMSCAEKLLQHSITQTERLIRGEISEIARPPDVDSAKDEN